MSKPLSSSTNSQVVNDDTNVEKHLHAATVIPAKGIVSPSVKNKKAGKRSGALNYTEEDTDRLLDIVKNKEPIGAHDWAAVATEKDHYAEKFGVYKRDIESLRMKFDCYPPLNKSNNL